MKLRSRKTMAAAPISHSALPQTIKRELGACSKPKKGESSKRRKVEKITSIYLPSEVIFNILLLLPAKLLQEVVRYVCNQWCDIVSDPSFVRAHCQMHATMSTSFIIQSDDKHHEVYCADQVTCKLTNIQLPFPARIQGSCNGLVLFSDVRDKLKVRLMNPLTKLMVTLPPMELRPTPAVWYSLAANSSGQYKMVQVLYASSLDSCEVNVCTIGVDKAWRPIDLQHSPGVPMKHVSSIYSLTTHARLIAGFLYWCHYFSYCFAMDVDTETFYRVNWPMDRYNFRFRSYFFSMGTALGLMTVHANEPGIWILRKLTDLKSSEWTEIYKINLDAIISKVSNGKFTAYNHNPLGGSQLVIEPVSLIDEEFCFYGGFHKDYSCLIHYNLANESFVSSKFNISRYAASYCLHVPTLASPKIPSK